jgi:hypothetical protein
VKIKDGWNRAPQFKTLILGFGGRKFSSKEGSSMLF